MEGGGIGYGARGIVPATKVQTTLRLCVNRVWCAYHRVGLSVYVCVVVVGGDWLGG